MMRSLTLFVASLAVAAPLSAAPLTVRVVDAAGRPVRDAVVAVYPSGGGAPAVRAGRFTIAQKNLQFRPFLSIVPLGSEVSFPNLDATKHHVYSFSAAKRFELKLFAKDQSRSVRFDKPGVVAVGCNIHDQMSAFIFVADGPWTARSNAQGVVTFADTRGAPARVLVWHPYLRAPGGMAEQRIAAGQRSATFSIRLRPPPPAMSMDY